ncbi:MFS transporter [Rickettsiales bacterium LUAb2]
MIVLFLITFLDLLGFGIIMPMIPVITHNYHLSSLHIGILASSFFFASFFGSIIIGYLSDIFGRKLILLICGIGVIIAYLLTGFIQTISHSFTLLIIGRLLTGFFSGNIAVVFAIVANISTPKTIVKNMAFLSTGITLGFMLGPTFGGYLSNNYDSVKPFYYTALCYVFCTLVAFFTLKEPKYDTSIPKSNLLNSLKSIFTNKDTLLFFSLFILLAFAFSGLEVFLLTQTLSIELKQTPFMVGLIWTYFAAVITIVQLFITKRIPSKKAIMIGLLSYSVGALALCFITSVSHAFIIMTIISFSCGLLFPNINANLALSGSPKQQGIIFGFNFAAEAIGGVLGPYILSYLFFLTNIIATVWITISVLLFLGFIVAICYFMKKS